MTDDSDVEKRPDDDETEGDEPTVTNGVMVLENGAVMLVVEVMPEQALKFATWADGVGVPLPQFMREGAEMLCNRLALNATVYASEEIKTAIEREDASPLVLN